MKYKKTLRIVGFIVLFFAIFIYLNPFYWGMKALLPNTEQPEETVTEKYFLDSLRNSCKCEVSRYYYNYKKERLYDTLVKNDKEYNYELALASNSKNNFIKNSNNFFSIAKKITNLNIKNKSSLKYIIIDISTIDRIDSISEESTLKSYKYLYDYKTNSIALEK